MLEIRQVTAAPVGESPVHNVSLRLPRGRIAVVRGPNGAGKSTLCRCIAGLTPYSGSVSLDDHEMPRDPVKIARQGLVVLQKGRRVFPAMTVEENLAVVLRAGVSRQRTAEVFDVFPHLAPRRNQQAGTLSGGEQQMVAIGRAILADPHVLVLDEPFLGLAPRVIHDLALVLGVLRSRGIAVLVTQENGDLAKTADDEYLMDGGRLIGAQHGDSDAEATDSGGAHGGA